MNKSYRGLSREEVVRSREIYGDNRLKKEKGKGIVKRFFENLSDPIIKILLAALVAEVVFTLGRCNLYEVFGIVAAVLIATTVSTLSEYGSERAFDKISKQSSSSTVRVIRDGEIIEIPADELVVGDISVVGAGEVLHADVEIVEGSILLDQSALNGENVEVQKRAGKGGEWSLSDPHRAFRGSVISEGEAYVRVKRVGSETYYGMVAKDVQTETRESPLKLRLGQLASQISKLGYIMAFVVGLTYLFFAYVVDNSFHAEEILFNHNIIPSTPHRGAWLRASPSC